jgi:hypothetical protein
MRACELSITGSVAKPKKPSHDEQNELKPQMRELILRFDAKDRHDENAGEPAEQSQPQRRRAAKSAAP